MAGRSGGRAKRAPRESKRAPDLSVWYLRGIRDGRRRLGLSTSAAARAMGDPDYPQWVGARNLDDWMRRFDRIRPERVALGVRRRRQHLGLSISDAARSAGVDRATWVRLESLSRGLPELTPETEEHIEWVLRWRRGALHWPPLDGSD